MATRRPRGLYASRPRLTRLPCPVVLAARGQRPMTTCGLCTPPLFTMRPRLERRRLSLQPQLAAADGALSRRRTAPALEPSLEQEEEEEKKEQKYR